MYTERRISQTPNPWLFRPIARRVAGVTVHSTRSGVSDGDDGPRTERWAWNLANGSVAKGWGSSCDLIIFEDGTRVWASDYMTQWPTYGAGYGGSLSLTFPLSEVHLQIEMAQGRIEDDYTDDQYKSFSEIVHKLADKHNFALNYLPYVDQVRASGVPRGLSTHDNCANGRKLGKSDPGPKWDKARSLIRTVSSGPSYQEIFLRMSLVEERVGDLERQMRDEVVKDIQVIR